MRSQAKKILYAEIEQDLHDWLQLQKYQTNQPISYIINYVLADCRDRKTFRIPLRKLQDEVRIEKRQKAKQKLLEGLNVSGAGRR